MDRALYTYTPYFGYNKFEWLGWLVVLRINVDLAIFQPYLDLEAGDNQSLKVQVATNAYLMFKLNMYDIILNFLLEAFRYRDVRFYVSSTVFK